jgi:hypothetical protein
MIGDVPPCSRYGAVEDADPEQRPAEYPADHPHVQVGREVPARRYGCLGRAGDSPIASTYGFKFGAQAGIGAFVTGNHGLGCSEG